MDRGENKYTSSVIQSMRNMPKSQLGAVIFSCRHHTLSECMNKKLFGMPSTHYSYVKNIDPGLPLFLFNCSDRKLHGIFKAVSCGQLNIDDQAWAYCERADYTPYAAQVRIDCQTKCKPLFEDEFKPVIRSNYYSEKLFWFELDKEQTRALIQLCLSKGLPEKVPRQPKTENVPRPPKAAKLINMFDALSISDTNEAEPDDEFENLDSQKGSDVSYASVDLATSCAKKKWTDFFTGSSSSQQEASNSHAFDQWEDHALEEDHGPQVVHQNEEFPELVSEGLGLAGGVPLPSSDAFDDQWEDHALEEDHGPQEVHQNEEFPELVSEGLGLASGVPLPSSDVFDDQWEDHALEEDHGPQEVHQNEEFHELVSEGLGLAGGVPLPSSDAFDDQWEDHALEEDHGPQEVHQNEEYPELVSEGLGLAGGVPLPSSDAFNDQWEDHALEEDHGPQEVHQNEEFHELVSEGLGLAGGVPLPSSENVNLSDKVGNESEASDSDMQSDMTDGADQGCNSALQYGLMKEIERLKLLQLKQGLKVESLERELARSKLEIDILKMRCHLLESYVRSSAT